MLIMSKEKVIKEIDHIIKSNNPFNLQSNTFRLLFLLCDKKNKKELYPKLEEFILSNIILFEYMKNRLIEECILEWELTLLYDQDNNLIKIY